MKSSAQIRGHPIHPMLVVFPVGLWITSLGFDIAYLATGNRFWYALSYWDMLAGVVGALVAAIPGFVDYFTLNLGPRARAVATTHMALNLAAVVLFVINLVLRAAFAAANAPTFYWVSAFSIIIVLGVAASGWLGGHLVYLEQVAVVTEPAERARDMIVELFGERGLAGAAGGEAPATAEKQAPDT